jgi:hypothetical protein
MKVTRRFQIRDAGDGRRYQLWVDDVLAGRCDYLGIEESLPEDQPGTVLELMLRQGGQRMTAKSFLWQFVEEKKKREEAGGTLFVWGQMIECEA